MANAVDVIGTMITKLKLKFEDYDDGDLLVGDIVETRGGTRILIGDVNPNFGVCDCCKDIRRSDIARVARLRRNLK